jgi:Na+-translocating ferredoxin:NAD+ oxidoreductase RnfA subunit
MFIFIRPFGAVAAGIGFALALALVAAVCEPLRGRDAAPAPVRAPEMAVHIPVTCARPEACGIVRAGS